MHGAPVIGPYQDEAPVCREYDARAAQAAALVAALIRSRLPGAGVEQIGSTAVPGCAGKGIVDLMLLYPPGQLAAARDALDALGFQRQTTRDPFPEERPMRTGAVVQDGVGFRLHVHVIAEASPEVAQLRRFAIPEEVAALVVYVCGPRASATTGAALRVDGGVVRSIVGEATMKRESPTARPSSRREDIVRLEDIPNVGPAVAADLRRLGITSPGELPGRDPYTMYDDLCRLTGRRHDPCLLDTFIAAVRFMAGEPKKPWWEYTAERKRQLAARRSVTP